MAEEDDDDRHKVGRRGPRPGRRDVILILGASGVIASARALAATGSNAPGSGARGGGATVSVDLSAIKPGRQAEVLWDGRRVYVRHRTPKEIEAARAVALSDLPDPQADEERVIDPEWLVVVGECTHAGCKPLDGLGDFGGWLCLCHGSQFDTSGRVRNGPALANLEVPPYRFADGTIEIGRN